MPICEEISDSLVNALSGIGSFRELAKEKFAQEWVKRRGVVDPDKAKVGSSPEEPHCVFDANKLLDRLRTENGR
jgi:hypothetical protein